MAATTTTSPPLYRGPSSFGNELLIITIVFSALAVAFVSLRLFSSIKYVGKLGKVDWGILVSLFLLLAFTTEYVLMIEKGGIGYNCDFVSLTQESYFLKVYYFTHITYCLGASSYKFAALLLYPLLSRERWFITALRVALVFLVIWTSALTFISIFIAWPINYNWEYVSGGTYNVDIGATNWSIGVSSLAIDVSLLFFPLPIVWQLDLSWKKKIGILALFLPGILVIAASAIRLYCLTTFDYDDFLGTSGGLAIWSFVDVSIGIIAVCLPALKPLLSRNGLEDEYKLSSKIQSNTRSSSPVTIRRRISDPEEMSRTLAGWGSNTVVQGGSVHPSVADPESARSSNSFPRSPGRSWFDSSSAPGSTRNSIESNMSDSRLRSEVVKWLSCEWASHSRQNSSTAADLPVSPIQSPGGSWLADNSTRNSKVDPPNEPSPLSGSRTHWLSPTWAPPPKRVSKLSKSSNRSSSNQGRTWFGRASGHKSSRGSPKTSSPSNSKKGASRSRHHSYEYASSLPTIPSVGTSSLDSELERRWKEEAMEALEQVLLREVRVEREVRIERIQT